MATNHTTGTVVKFKAAGQVSMDTVPLIAVIRACTQQKIHTSVTQCMA